jgi:hypothetical protein
MSKGLLSYIEKLEKNCLVLLFGLNLFRLISLTIILFLLGSNHLWSQGQCLSGGCTGGTNYPSGTFTNNTQNWSTVSSLIYAGEYATYNVTEGSTYEWSLLPEDGASCSYDAQLTLLSSDGSVIICYSDDYSGILPKLSWTATTTTTVRVLVSQYYCATNSTATTLRWRCASPSNDNCSGAIALTVYGSSCGGATNGDVSGATESLPGCVGTANNDVWFKFVATSASFHTVTVVGSSGFDAVVDVRSGACNGSSIACSDISGDGGTESVNLTGLTSGNTYYVRVYDYWSGIPETTTFTICITSPSTCIPYYSYGTSSGDLIDRVQLGTLDNSPSGTGSESGGYYNDYYSSVSAPNIYEGSLQNLKVTVGSYGGQTVAAWIDYNQDGDFTDANEKIGEISNVAGLGTTNINFNVPNGAIAGNTRMRVRTVWSTTSLDPCATYGWGEAEDYKVNVVLCTTPGTPASLSTTNISANSATLSWNAGSPSGSSTITYYWALGTSSSVTYEANYLQRGTTTSPTVSVNVSDLSEGLTYYWTVKAVTSCNGTISSYAGVVSFKACTTPGKPSLNSPSLNPTDATISWTPNATIGSPIVSYYWAINNSSTVNYETNYIQRGITTSPITSAYISNLTSNTNYWWTVKAVTGCSNVSSEYATIGSFTTPCQTPGSPTNMNTTAIGTNTATLNWTAGTPQGSATVTYYWAIGTTSGVTYESSYSWRGTTTNLNVTQASLTAGTTYYWTVKAVTSCNGSASTYPAALSFTTTSSSGIITWSGNTSEAWDLGSNWVGGVVPTVSNDVVIPGGCPRYPNITTVGLSINNTTVTNRCKSLTINSGAKLTIDGAIYLYCSGIVNISGVLNHHAGYGSGRTAINSGGIVTVKNGGYLNIGSNQLSGGTSGTPTGTIEAINDIYINAGQLIVESGGTVYIQDQLRLYSSSNTLFRQDGGSVYEAMSGSGSATTDKFSVATTAVFRMMGGTLYICGDSDGITTDWDAIFFNASSIIDIQGGTIELLNGSTPADFTLSIANTATVLNNLIINKTGKTVLIDGNDVAVGGDVTLTAGTLNANSYNITVAGNWTNNGGTFTGGSGTLTFTGSGKTIGGSAATAFAATTFDDGAMYSVSSSADVPQASFGNLTLNSGSNLTLNSGKVINLTGATNIVNGTLNAADVYDGIRDVGFNNTSGQLSGTGLVNADLQVSSGSTQLMNDFTFNGDLFLNTGTLVMTTHTLTVNGSWYNSGTFTPGTGKVIFNGTGKTIGGTLKTSFYNLSINSGADISINPSGVSPNERVEVTNTFDLQTNAVLTLADGKRLSLFSSTNLINGSLNTLSQKYNYGTTTSDYEVYIRRNNTLTANGTISADILFYRDAAQTSVTTLGSNITVDGSICVHSDNSGATLSLNGKTLNLYGSLTNSGVLNESSGSSTVNLFGSGRHIVGSIGTRFYNLNIKNGADYNINPSGVAWPNQSALVYGSFYGEEGSRLNIAASKVLDLYGSANVFDGIITADGVFDNVRDIDINNTTNLSGTGTTNADLRIYGGTTTLVSDFILDGDFIIRSAAGTFTMTDNVFTVGGCWTNDNVFNAGTGTVKFTGAHQSTVSANCYYSGAAKTTADFYNVVIERTSDTLCVFSTPMRVANNFHIKSGVFATGYKTRTTGTVGHARRLTVVGIATIDPDAVFFVAYKKINGATGENNLGTADSLNIPVFKGDLINYGWIKTNRPIISGYSDLKLTGARITGTGTMNEFGVDIQPEDNTTVVQVGPVDIEGDLIIQDPAANLWENTDLDNVLTIRGNFYLYGSFIHNGTVNVYGNLTNAGNVINTLDLSGSTFNFYHRSTGSRLIRLDNPSGYAHFNHVFIRNNVDNGTRVLCQEMTVDGNLVIESGRTLDVNSSSPATVNNAITLAGATSSWINNGLFVPQAGTVTFSGNSEQLLGGTTATEFYNLTVNKSNSSRIMLGNNATVTHNLSLTQGFVQTNYSNLLILGNSSTVIPTGGQATSFVRGPLRKIGNTDFVFPIGKNVVWARTEIKNVSGQLITDEFTAEYINTTFDIPDIVWDSYQVIDPLHHVSSVEYWNITQNVGTATKKVALYTEDKSISDFLDFDDEDMVIAHYNSSLSKWENIGNTGNSGSGDTGWILSNEWSTFSPFTFGSLSKNNPLPVELVYFKAVDNCPDVLLKWTVASEINNDYFEIEKSYDLKNIDRVGIVDGAGNTNYMTDYNFIDKNPAQGIVYYRLKQVDFDGTISYSNWSAVRLFCGVEQNEVKPEYSENFDVNGVYPNPTNGQLYVLINNYTGQIIHYEIFDLMSRKLLSGNVSLFVGSNEISLNISDFTPATYILILRSDKTIKQFKIVKQ